MTVEPASRTEGGASKLRVAVWVLHVALPLLGLWLLLAQPDLDVAWEDHLWHFWLVGVVAAINAVLGLRISEAARRHDDARLFVVGLAFLASAGFFGLHALATPTVLLTGANAGFQVASPVGLVVFAALAAVSALDLSGPTGEAIMRRQPLLQWAVIGLLGAWAAVSLAGLPPLDAALDAEQARGPAALLTIAGVPLYGFAAGRYVALYRRRPSVMLISLITAFVLLAEALAAMPLARAWAASWWAWHVLMLAAFGFIAYSAHVQYRREGGGTALFNAISLRETVRRIREEHAQALEELVEAMRAQAETGAPDAVHPTAARLADRFGLTEGQVEVLERAAEALAGEREQTARLAALVALGRESRVMLDEEALLGRALDLSGGVFRADRLGIRLVQGGRLRPLRGDGTPARAAAEAAQRLETIEGSEGEERVLAFPLTVKDRAAGVLEVRRRGRGFHERERSVLESLAVQLSIALENVRLYAQIDALFRQYLSPDVATALLADPDQASLGGGLTEVTVLFGDLRGFTSFSERTDPGAVVELLNAYFGAAVPLVLARGGTVDKFVGDAIMALWGAPTRQLDHARRAAAAALAIQGAIEDLPGDPDRPRFRIGINTGTALVGNIGSDELRNYTAIGDTVNLASRLQELAEPGRIAIGEATLQALGEGAVVEPLGEVRVKGREAPVRAYLLEDLLTGPG
ncbi:MAG TPA: adenylate/guanylate cyclase domain-containing protein [Actinomycetota bacterium]